MSIKCIVLDGNTEIYLYKDKANYTVHVDEMYKRGFRIENSITFYNTMTSKEELQVEYQKVIC